MTTFFKKIQSYFTAGYHGRYLGLILEELCELHPEILCEFVYEQLKIPEHERFTKPSFKAEFAYKSDGMDAAGVPRRADFAVFDQGVPKVLIEIKFHDHEIQDEITQESQFEDYLKWAEAQTERKVMIISLNPLNTKGMSHAYWSDFAEHLKKYEVKSELATLLRKYLQAEKIALQNIDKTALLGFLAEAVPSAENILTGNREKFQLYPVSDVFDNFQNNLRILSMPCVKRIKSIDPTKQWQGIDHEVSSSSQDGALDVLRLYSQHVLTGKPGFWCLRYGIELWEVNSNEMQCNLYSCVWDWKGTADVTKYAEISIENLTDKLCEKSSEISLTLHNLISETIKVASAQLSADSAKNTDICAALEKLKAQF